MQVLKQWLAEHAISPEIAQARPYTLYESNGQGGDCPEPVARAYAKLGNQRGYMTYLANQGDGVIFDHHRAPGLGLSHVYPQMRPWDAVETDRPTVHYHPTKRVPGHVPAWKGQPLRKQDIHSFASMKRHIAKAHRGGNSEVVHEHPNLAKYLFVPSALHDETWWQDDDLEYYGNPDTRAAHDRRYHKGQSVRGKHEHTRRVKDPEGGRAKRLDVHPLAVPLFEDSETIYFGIEGCIKADAILSEILKTGAKASVFSVPSVTLWRAPELDDFVRKYLRGKRVVIVPDADWHKNKLVVDQATSCWERLLALGVEARVMAPPYDPGDLDEVTGKPRLNGVDDYLAAGGTLEELQEVRLGINVWNYQTWKMQQSGRRDGVHRDAVALGHLAVHADPDGKIRASLATLAKNAKLPERGVDRAIESLERRGAIEVDGSLEKQFGRWVGKLWVRGWDFVERPTITILVPELRAFPKDTDEPLPIRTTDEAKIILTADYFEQRRSLGKLTALEREAWEIDQRGEKQPDKAHRDAFRRAVHKREVVRGQQAPNPSI